MPTTKKTESYTHYKNQTDSYFQIYESEEVIDSINLEKGRLIGDVTLIRKDSVPKGTKSFEEMSLSKDGNLFVRTTNPETDEEFPTTIKIQY